MKVVTWNIWKGKYLDKVIDQLADLDADIIGLQEVKAYQKDSQNINIGEVIAKKLGYHFIYCKSFTTDRHYPSFDQGNAMLSRLPIHSSHCHFLSTMDDYKGDSATEPRTAVEVEISINGQIVSIFNTHLGYAPDLTDTPLQMQQIHNLLDITSQKNSIVIGDFNVPPTSSLIQAMESTFTNTDKDGSLPTRIEENNEGHIDYIFVPKDMAFSHFQIHDTTASDHRPLSVELKL